MPQLQLQQLHQLQLHQQQHYHHQLALVLEAVVECLLVVAIVTLGVPSIMTAVLTRKNNVHQQQLQQQQHQLQQQQPLNHHPSPARTTVA